jgi:hypothetical protein
MPASAIAAVETVCAAPSRSETSSDSRTMRKTSTEDFGRRWRCNEGRMS